MNLSAVLLTGGESRRMGKDKATALFQGKPLWQIQLNLLQKLQPAETLVSARTDPAWRPADVKFVADEPPSRGPLSGVAASLGRIRTKHLLALAIDMPFRSENYLRFLCDQIQPGRAVLPIIGDRAEPLAAIYPAEANVDLTIALSGFDFSLQTLARQLIKMAKLKVVFVTEEEEAFFRNLNEPIDLE